MRNAILRILTLLVFTLGWSGAAQAQLKFVQTGDNQIGSVTDNGAGSYTIVGGGNDIWDQADEMSYFYREAIGDFEVKVRVESFTPNARWSKAGIMARESLSEFSRMAFVRVTPADVPTTSGGNGANDVVMGYRTGINGSGLSGGSHEDRDGANPLPNPNFPNAWLKLARIGNTIYSSNSIDGVAWNFVASQDTATWNGGAFGPSILLGLATSRHSGGPTATAEYRNYSYTAGSGAPFNVIGASSRGNPNGVAVYFNRPPGAGSTTAANYSLSAPLGTIVTGLRLTTANDAPERDPMTYTLEGTTGTPAAGPWTLIASGNTGLGTGRKVTAPDISFVNSTPYTSYRLIFPTVRDAGAANSMQIAEVELLGPGGVDVTKPGDAVIPSSLNSPMPNEVSIKAIDNDINTKYLNFDKLNTGLTITPSLGSTPPTITAAAPFAGSPNVIQLTTSPLVEGIPYTLNADPFFIVDASGGGMINGTANFVHGAGLEALRIRVNHSHTDNGSLYNISQAVKRGLGELTPLGAGTFPGSQVNNVFEDPIPDDGANEQFSSRVGGVLNITTTGNYTFYMSSDDLGYLYLSSDDSPANKVLIAREPAWNGRREYIAGGNQASRGSPPANISAPKSLVAGKKYYLEVVYTEGGGGNNGSAAWLPPGGPAVANGSTPIEEANFAPTRSLDGNVFYNLGPVVILTQPATITVSEGQGATFSVRPDGTPLYGYQWRRNGVPIPGATGQSYTTPPTAVADEGALYSVVVNNEFSTVTSADAVLHVFFDNVKPTLVSARGVGNPLSFDLVYSEPVNAADAVNLANYSVSSGVTLSAAVLQPDTKTVRFTSSSLTTPGLKTLTVNNVRDRAFTPNTILANSTIPITYADGNIRRHFWKYPSGGGTVASVTGDPRFPNSPDNVSFPTTFEDTQPDTGDAANESFGVQFLGFISPPVSGNYNFFMSSDDNGALWLSTDDNPANKVQIAREPQWNGHRAYSVLDRRNAAAPENRSSTLFPAGIPLVAGQRYYIECIFSEGGGGNNMSVAWQLPGGPVPPDGSDPIQAAFLSPFNVPVSIPATEPANVTTFEGRKATFTVHVTGSPVLTFQWFKNGGAITDATNSSYTTPTLAFPGDNGSTYYVVVANSISSVQSRTATLTVQDDTTAPHILSAEGNSTFDKITLHFDEPIEPGSAVDTFNYGVSGGVGIIGAAVGADGQSVILSLDPLTPMQENTLYTVTVSGINDLALPPNTIAANSTVQFRSFVFSCGFVLFQAYDTASTPGNAVSLLTSHPNFPNNPRDTAYIKSFNSREAYPNDSHEQYGGRISGVFVPPVSGNYLFYLASDDASQLFLNPAGKDAAGKVLLTEETGCCNPFAAHASGPQTLVAGQAYYIEGLYKEGVGGDFIQVAAKLDSDPTDPNALSPIPAGSLGIYSAPINATFTITTQPASQTKSENQTVTFSVAATVAGAPVSSPAIQWQRSDDNGATWVNIPNANGASYSKSFLTIANDNGDKYRAELCVPGASALSGVATLTVIADHQPPHVLSCAGSGTMNSFTLVFDEPVESGSAQDSFNYSITDGANPLAITGFSLSADAMTLTIQTAVQAENTAYTITINGVNDIASPPNVIAPDTHVTCHSFVFSGGILLFETYNTPAAGTAVSLLTSSPNYPNNPRERFYIPTFDTRNAYPDDSHEQYGGRITGMFVPKVSGNYIFYLRSDDASELWFNATGPDAGGATLIQAETGCCGAFSGHATAPQALTAGTRYFIMCLYKEGGGGDYAQVAVKLDTDPTNPDALAPISSGLVGIFADPTGAIINITQQPTSKVFCQVSAGPPNLANESFNSGNGGYTVQTPLTMDGPWAYDAVRGTWHADGQGPDNGHPNTSLLNSPVMNIVQPGGVRLSINHRWSFEFDGTAWDGGQLRMSVNGGAFTTIPAAAFTQSGYNGAVQSATYTGVSDLRGQVAYVSTSPNYATGFETTVANLGNFNPGDTLRIQFFYAADSNTKNQTPAWEVDAISLSQGITDSSTVTFTVVANASLPSNPNQTIFYQWQRNNGGGFQDVPGANGPSLTLVPSVADNGACFRAQLSIPGATKFTDTACLTVTHRNTAPSFNCGPNQAVDEDTGPHTVANWATGISPDSINGASGTFTTDFSAGLPAGTAVYGNAHIDGGFLHLTDNANGQQGSFIINDILGGAPLGSFTIDFKALLGQGTAPPADGFSVSIANNLPNASFGEEGEGTGIRVAFDSYDNGGGEAPAIDVYWGGSVIAHTSVASLETGGQFVPVSIVLHADGKLDVTAAGTPVYQNLVTGYVPISGARFGFGGRTGGLNENNFIDNISIAAQATDDSAVEANQVVTFLVSNDNPGLFSQQPAVSANGTLTYTAAPNGCGSATVTVIAMDSGGTACNGIDKSAPCRFTITIHPLDDCPIAFPQVLNVNEDSSIGVVLGAFDADVAGGCGLSTLTFTIVTPPAHGTLSGTAPNLVYTPTPGYPSGCGHNNGADSFSYVVSDGECTSQAATITIRVVEVNDCPTAVAQVNPLCAVPGINGLLVISGNGSNACVILDGTHSSDPECDPITYAWYLDGSPVAFSTSALTTNCFPLGLHHFTLAVKDGQCDGIAQVSVEIVTACEAVEALIDDINNSNITRKNKRPFLASLKAACASFDRGSMGSGLNQLNAFINKVRAQVSKDNPVEAARFIAEAQAIIDGINCAQELDHAMNP